MPRRIEFQLDERDYKELEDLKKLSGAFSLAETIRNALSTYYWMVEKTQEGYTIVAEKFGSDSRKIEPILPFRPKSNEQGKRL
jgi:hypothetical protein